MPPTIGPNAACVAIEATAVGDAAAHFRETESDQTNQNDADQIRQECGGAEHRSGNPRQSENARPDDAI